MINAPDKPVKPQKTDSRWLRDAGLSLTVIGILLPAIGYCTIVFTLDRTEFLMNASLLSYPVSIVISGVGLAMYARAKKEDMVWCLAPMIPFTGSFIGLIMISGMRSAWKTTAVTLSIAGLFAIVLFTPYFLDDSGQPPRLTVAINQMKQLRSGVMIYCSESPDGKPVACQDADCESRYGVSIRHRYIDTIEVTRNGSIIATLKGMGQDFNGKTLTLSPVDETLSKWKWSGTISRKYIPANH